MEKGKLFRIWRNRKTGKLQRSWKDTNSESLNLVFDSITRIVYYKFSEFSTMVCENCNSEADFRVGYMTPYISENGKYCRFINEEIVEID